MKVQWQVNGAEGLTTSASQAGSAGSTAYGSGLWPGAVDASNDRVRRTSVIAVVSGCKILRAG